MNTLSKLNGSFVAIAIALCLTSSCNSGSFTGSSSENKPAANAKPQVPQPTPVPTANPVAPVVPVTPVTPATPPGSVTQGSFTVWANPANPAPGQNYDIFIAVRLPTAVAVYTEADLSGSIVGTDQYQQMIAPATSYKGIGMQSFSYVPGSGQAQLIVHVPGAQTKVRDTVNIRSTLLNEAQTIGIIFQ